MDVHVRVGADLVGNVPALRDPAPLFLHHHARYDGTGYPAKLAGDRIPLLARILCVADAHQALCSSGPYRPALSAKAAREELRRGARSRFDPAVVAAFLRVLDSPEVIRRVWQVTLGFAPDMAAPS